MYCALCLLETGEQVEVMHGVWGPVNTPTRTLIIWAQYCKNGHIRKMYSSHVVDGDRIDTYYVGQPDLVQIETAETAVE